MKEYEVIASVNRQVINVARSTGEDYEKRRSCGLDC